MKIGIVTAIDQATCKCRVKFADQDGMESFWLPVLHHKTGQDKSYWMPDLNEHVCCLLDDNAEFGCILGAIYSDADQPPVASQDKCHVKFKDGTTIEYDRAAHLLKADVKGDVELVTTGKVTATIGGTLTADVSGNTTLTTPLCTINGNLKVNGNITASGKVADANGTKTMDGMRAIFNTHTHKDNSHGATTNLPDQQQ